MLLFVLCVSFVIVVWWVSMRDVKEEVGYWSVSAGGGVGVLL